MKKRRDYTGNEMGIPGGAWFVETSKNYKKLQEFYKTHEWKGNKIGWIKKEGDKYGEKN